MSTFAQRFKELRLEKNKTQKDLANIFFKSYTSISKYENGKAVPEHALLNDMADYFGVSMDYLLGWTDTRTDVSSIANHEKNLISQQNSVLELTKALYHFPDIKIVEVPLKSSNEKVLLNCQDINKLVNYLDLLNIDIESLLKRIELDKFNSSKESLNLMAKLLKNVSENSSNK